MEIDQKALQYAQTNGNTIDIDPLIIKTAIGWYLNYIENHRVPERESCWHWKHGADRSMEMWNKLPDDPVKQSLPLLFKTVIPDVGTHIRLGYYDGNRDAFIESGIPRQTYRERVESWYQFPMPPTETEVGKIEP